MSTTATTAPSIEEAKALALKHRRRGIIILAFGDSDYSRCGYGMTRADCRAMAAVSEQIAALIADGTIAFPD